MRGSRFLAEAEALLAVRVHGWRAAAPRFAALPPPDGGPSAAELLRAGQGPGLDLALPVRRAGGLSRAEAERIVVATARFGDGPLPAPPFQELPGLRFLLLADRDLAVPGWETVRVPAARSRPGARHAARPHPRRRAARRPGARGRGLAVRRAGAAPRRQPRTPCSRRWLVPQAFALCRHPRARGWREAVEDGLLAGAAPGPLVALAEACEAAGLADGRACDTRAVWRRHGDPGVAALMDAWAARAVRPRPPTPPSPRSSAEPAAPAAPRILPAALGGLDDGLLLRRRPLAGAAAAPGPAARRRPGGCRSPSSTPRNSPPPPRPSCAAASSPSSWPSTCPDRYDVAWTSDVEGTRDRVVVVLKGVLQTRRAGGARRARAPATSPSSAPGTT